jgi:molybdopterin synthase catalytic subunit
MPSAAHPGCYTDVVPAMPIPLLSVTADPLDVQAVVQRAEQEAGDGRHGAVGVFIGNVRGENLGRRVIALHYEAYEPLALAEGQGILDEAAARFGSVRVAAAHRHGSLAPGEVAVVVVAAAPHRQEAFAACRWIIDEIKERLPVWKREHYADGASEWVGCGCHRDGEPS